MQRCFVFLLYYCGLRRGEALGMTAADVDLKRLQARVCRSVEFIGNKSSVKPPKSAKGFRAVPIASDFAAFLADYLPTVPGGYLVHNADGGIMTQSGFRRMWESIISKLNIAAGGTKKISVIHGLTPHIFRHNFCSELCYQVPEISTKKIAAIMGHDESMTIQVYSHILEEREDAPAAIERIFAAK
jgi:integrase